MIRMDPSMKTIMKMNLLKEVEKKTPQILKRRRSITQMSSINPSP